MRVFYWREKIRKSEYFSLFLGAYKIPRGFLARVFQNFGNKKASKLAARKKKPLWLGVLLTTFCVYVVSVSRSLYVGFFAYEILYLSFSLS